MNIYVETNFILELVFVQEQYQSCEEIITLCEAGRAKLILPFVNGLHYIRHRVDESSAS